MFFAFAEKVQPDGKKKAIAIAVYVENAGWGASYAGPIAGLMIEKYLNDTIAPDRKKVEERMLKADLFVKHPDYNKMLEKMEAAKRNPVVPRQEDLPDPNAIPSDVPEGTVTTEVGGKGKSERKR